MLTKCLYIVSLTGHTSICLSRCLTSVSIAHKQIMSNVAKLLIIYSILTGLIKKLLSTGIVFFASFLRN